MSDLYLILAVLCMSNAGLQSYEAFIKAKGAYEAKSYYSALFYGVGFLAAGVAVIIFMGLAALYFMGAYDEGQI